MAEMSRKRLKWIPHAPSNRVLAKPYFDGTGYNNSSAISAVELPVSSEQSAAIDMLRRAEDYLWEFMSYPEFPCKYCYRNPCSYRNCACKCHEAQREMEDLQAAMNTLRELRSTVLIDA